MINYSKQRAVKNLVNSYPYIGYPGQAKPRPKVIRTVSGSQDQRSRNAEERKKKEAEERKKKEAATTIQSGYRGKENRKRIAEERVEKEAANAEKARREAARVAARVAAAEKEAAIKRTLKSARRTAMKQREIRNSSVQKSSAGPPGLRKFNSHPSQRSKEINNKPQLVGERTKSEETITGNQTSQRKQSGVSGSQGQPIPNSPNLKVLARQGTGLSVLSLSGSPTYQRSFNSPRSPTPSQTYPFTSSS